MFETASQGQFAIVIEDEMPSMLKAFRSIDPKYRPKLTIVVCVSFPFFLAHLPRLFSVILGQTSSHSLLPHQTRRC
jgi:hypothetical protein